MDIEKQIKLKKFYKEIPEQQLLDFLSEGENQFEEGAYALLVEEAKRRGLEDRLNEIKKKIAEEEKIAEERKADYKFVSVFVTPMMGEIAVIKSILDNEKIPYFIKGENFGTLYGPADGLSSVEVIVREDYVDYAKKLLQDFINPSKETT